MTSPRSAPEWLTPKEIGRVYGVSAHHIDQVLLAAGLRHRDGGPTAVALRRGLAQRRHSTPSQPTLWNREGCAPHLERQGLRPRRQPQLVDLWADWLSALQQGGDVVVMSAEDIAAEIPPDLVGEVNNRLRERGCGFEVGSALRRTPHGPAGLPAPAADASGFRRRG
jgi:hypothetical protein